MPPHRRFATPPRLVGALLVGAFLVGPAAAQTVLPAQSSIGFTSKQMGVPVDGSFKRWAVQLSFDPKKPEAGKVVITIDAASASFGAPETDAEMPKPAWFDTAKFPQAVFRSTAIKPLGGGRFDVAGQLAIKGRAQDVVVPITLAPAGALTTASGAFTIKRLDFLIGQDEWADTSMVANDVQVKFKLAVSGLAPL